MPKSIYIALLFSVSLHAQPAIQWQTTFGGSEYDELRFIEQTSDGGYVIVGTTYSDDGDVMANNGLSDIWLTKMDSMGIVEWRRNYGGSSYERGYWVEQSADGGFLVVGYTESNDGDVSGHHGDGDIWALKLDPFGNIQWQKCLGGSKFDTAWEVQLTQDNGYVIVGVSDSPDGDVTGHHGATDCWVVKLQSTGDIEWQRALGGSNFDHGYSVSPTNDGGYIVAGQSQSTDGHVAGNIYGSAAWVLKLNFEGKVLWQKTFGGSLTDRANKVVQTKEGGYILFGQTESNDGDVTGNHGISDLWALKLDEQGNIQWQRALGGTQEDYGRSIYQNSDGSFVAVGTVISNNGDVSGNHGARDVWVVKLSEQGELLWQKSLGGTMNDFGFAIQQTTDGGYIIGGETWSKNGDLTGIGSKGYTDFWVIKLAPETSPTLSPNTPTLSIFPNPATHTISLQTPDSQEHITHTTIADLLGRTIMQVQGGQNLNIAALPNGTYLVAAIAHSGKTHLGRFQKE